MISWLGKGSGSRFSTSAGAGVAAGGRAFACFDDKVSSQPPKMITDTAMPVHSASLDLIGIFRAPNSLNQADLIRREQVKPQLLLSTGSSTRRLGRNRVPIGPYF